MAQKRKQTRSTSRLLALEPRLLFDGAAMVAAQDVVQPDDDKHDTQSDASEVSSDTSREQKELGVEGGLGAPTPQNVVIIDSRVANYQDLAAEAQANGAQVHVVGADESGITVIGNALVQAGNVANVQVIALDANGSSQLGTDTVTQDQLQQRLDQDLTWSFYASGNGAQAEVQSVDASFFVPMQARMAVMAVDTAVVNDIKDPTTAPRVTKEDTELVIKTVQFEGSGTGNVTITIKTDGGTSSLTDSRVTSDVNPETGLLTITGSINDINAVLASSGIRFTPAKDQNSLVDGYEPKITISSNGKVLEITNISVTAVNDDPNFSTQVPVVLKEGQSQNLSIAQLAESWEKLDADIGTGQQVKEQLVIIIDSLPSKGMLTFAGSAVRPGQVISATDIDKLVYTASGDDLASLAHDSFVVTVKDGGGGSKSGSIGIDIHPKNVAPSVGNSGPSLAEGQKNVSIDPQISLGDAYDEAHPHTITIENVVTGGQGTFTYTNAANVLVTLQPNTVYHLTLAESKTLVFSHNGSEPNAPGAIAPSYTVTVIDAGGGEAGVTSSTSGPVEVKLNITPINDDPLFHYNPAGTGSNASTPLTLPESLSNNDSIINLKDYLKVTDDDIGTQNKNLVYTLTQRPGTAEIQLYVGGTVGYAEDGWVTLGNGARFTQADIDAGQVRILQTGTAAQTDSFTFQVRDSVYGPFTDADGNIVPGEPREGAVRDPVTGDIKDIKFHLAVNLTDPENNSYPDGPREPTPGYGTGSGQGTTTTGPNGTSVTVTDGNNTWTNEIKAIVVDPGNKAQDKDLIWNEANVGASDGGYVLDKNMLAYEIVRSLSNGTTVTTLEVPPDEVIYTMLEQPGNGSIQRLINGTWTTVATLDQFSQGDINEGHIRFVSNGSEVHDSSFKFVVGDGTNLSHEGSFRIDITPTNDRPVASGGSAAVEEGMGTGETNDPHTTYLGSGALGMSDADLSESPDKRVGEGVKDPLWFQITSLPEHGTLERFDGTSWVLITDADINNGQWFSSKFLIEGGPGGNGSGLRYLHDGSEPLAYAGGKTQVSFTYEVRDDLSEATNPREILNTPLTGANTDGSVQSNVSAPGTTVIHITPINGAPQIKVTPDSAPPEVSGVIAGGGDTKAVNEILSVNEGGTGAIVKGLLTAIDSDNTTVQRQYQLTAVPEHGQLLLNGKPLGVGSTFTQKDIDDGKLTYKHNGDEPGFLKDANGNEVSNGNANGRYNDLFKFKVSDGAQTSEEGQFWIDVTPLNDAPTVAAKPGDEDKLWVIDSSVEWVNLPKVDIADPDLANGIQGQEQDLVKVTIELKDGDGAFAAGQLRVDYNGSDITVTGAGTSTLVIEGTLAGVQKALDVLQAKTNGTDVDRSDLILKITVDDRVDGGGANGGSENANGTPVNSDNNTASITFKIAASDKNDVPEITPPTSPIVVGGKTDHFVVVEDSSSVLGGIVITDKDDFGIGNNYTVIVSVVHGTLSGGGSTNEKTITLAGKTLAEVNAFLASISYKGDANFNGKDDLTVTVNDGGNHGQDGIDGDKDPVVIQKFTIYVRPQNDAPVINLPKADTNITLTAGSYEFKGNTAIQITDVDIEDAANVGKDGHQLNDLNTFSVLLSAQSGNNNVGHFALTNGQTNPVDGEEYTIGNVTVVFNVGKVTLTGKLAEINALLAGGVIYEAGSSSNIDGKIVFSVTADDGGNGGTGLNDTDLVSTGEIGSLTDSKQLTFLVTQENDPPSFDNFPSESPVYVQTGGALTLTPNGDLRDPELDLFDNWGGSTLTITHADASIADGVFGFDSSKANVNGTSLTVNGKVIATVTNTGDGKLVIQFNVNANNGDVDKALSAITYRNDSSSAPRTITLNYEIKDGNSNTGGADPKPGGSGQDQGTGGELIGSKQLTIIIDRPVTVTAPNDNSGGSDNTSDHVVYERGLSQGSAPSHKDLEVVSNFTINAPDGVDTVTIEYKSTGDTLETRTLTKAELEGLSETSSISIASQFGTLVLNSYSKDATTGVITVSYGYTLSKAPTVSGTDTTEQFKVTAKDIDSSAVSSKSGTISIRIVDDVPSATPDSNDIGEDATAPATGNVITGTGASNAGKDTVGADGAAITGVVKGNVTGPVTGNVGGGGVKGSYGTVVIDANGGYTYTLDNSNLDVQGLKVGETLTETYTYTIRDKDGDPATTTLTITIHGQNDGVTVAVPNDDSGAHGNVNDHVVFESGLPTGSNQNPNDLKVQSSFTVKALDGVDTISIVYGSTHLDLTESELRNLGSINKTISTPYGSMVLNGYSKAADGTITVSYTYTLTNAPSNTSTSPENTIESFTITVQDRANADNTGKDSDTKTLNIRIVDDAPKAANDIGTVNEGATVSKGAANGVLANDKSGADGWDAGGAVVGVVAGNTGTPTSGVGTEIAGTYGTLTLNVDGSYTYVANPNVTTNDVQDVFTYMVKDADGDTTSATLTINVKDVTLANTASSGTVKESGLSSGSTAGSGHTINNQSLGLPSGQTSIAINGTGANGHGTFVVNANGTYSYMLTSKTSGDTVTDSFTYTAKDANGNTVTNTVTISIVDDTPTAAHDTDTVNEGSTVSKDAANGVLANDKSGADGWDAGGAVVGVVAGNTGTPTSGVGTEIAGTYGTLTLNVDGSYTYVANPNVTTNDVQDVFTYMVKDADGDTTSATLTINVKDVTLANTASSGTVKESGLGGGSTEGSDHIISGESLGLPTGQTAVASSGNGANGHGTFVVKADGTYEYTLAMTTDGKGITDTFTYIARDEFGNTVSNTITVTILDDVPEAKDDVATVNNGTNIATSNALGNDTLGADRDTLVSSAKGPKDAEPVGVDTVTGTITLTGEHGKLVIAPNGEYTYTRNDGSPLQAVEVFDYTITDKDGDTSAAQITITIADNVPVITDKDGNPPVLVPVDPADPTSPTRPVLKPDGSVSEGGLPDGSTPGSGNTTTGTIVLTPGDDTTTVVVTPPGGTPVELTPGVPTKVDTPQGEVTLTYTEGDTSTGEPPKVAYTYELKTPVDDTQKSPTDEFTVTVTDKDGDRSTVTVVVDIVDDVPEAKDDVATVNNGTNIATGNALGNDTLGADRDTLVSSAKGPKDAEPVGVDTVTGTITLTGEHGKLVIAPNGEYTYTRNDGSPLQAVEVFDYTITDKDGDTSAAQITITIADNVPVITDKDGNPPVLVPVDPADPTSPTRPVLKPDGSVSEGGLPDGSTPGSGNTTTGTIVLTPGDDTTTVVVTPPGGTPVELTPGVPTKVDTPQGEVTLTYTEGDTSTGEPPKVAYTYELKTPVDDTQKSPTDEFTVTVTDKDGDRSTVTVVVDIVDDVPEAKDDVATVNNGTNIATGNALGNDTLGADRDTLVSSAKGPKDAEPVGVDTVTGTITLTGEHGKLVIAPNGEYTYTRNDGSPLQAVEVFDYTITDKDGDTSAAQITITIADNVPVITDKDGNPPVLVPVDPADPTSPTRPVLKPDGSVSEGGLPDGSTPGSGNTTTGTIVLTPGDDTTTVVVTPPGGTPVELTPGVPTKVDTPQGEVTLTYTEGDTSTGEPPKVTYTYELKTPVDDTQKSPTDEFTVTVTDKDGDRSTVTVVVDIVDDVPEAKDDVATVNNGTNIATGNALGNDTLGADRDTLVSSAKGPKDAEPVGVDTVTGTITLTGEHGKLVIAPNGEYTYTRNDGSPLQAVEVFDYTITDKDGDTSAAQITITIADNVPVITDKDGNPPVLVPVDPADPTSPTRPVLKPDGSVSEGGLPDGSTPGSGNTTTGTIVLTPGDDTTTVVVTPPGGTPVELTPGVPTKVDTPQGEVTLTYTEGDTSTGEPPKVAYTYELKTPVDDTQKSPTDEFTVTVTDKDGDRSTVTVVVDIVDDVPEAKDDVATVNNGTNIATGNALGNDTLGADRDTLVSSAKGPKDAEPVGVDTVTGTITLTGEHGKLVIAPNGEYTYTRNDGSPLQAVEVFDYTITDKDGDTSAAQITITIADNVPVITDKDGNPPVLVPVDPADPTSPTRPVLKPDGSVSEGGLPDGSTPGSGNTTTGTIVLTPGDDTTTVVVTPPGGTPVELTPGVPTKVDTPQGEVTLTYTEGDTSTGEPPKVAYTYELKTPVDDTQKSPTDEFTVTVTDKDGDRSTVTVVVDIVDDVPEAKDDVYITKANEPISGNLGDNDTHSADGQTWAKASDPIHGTVTVNPDGSYTYVPTPGYVGTDTFTYTITDKDGDTSTATVTITVLNTLPVAVDDSNVTKPGEPAEGNVLTGGSADDHPDSDPDGHLLTVTEITVDGQTYTVPTKDHLLILLPGKGALQIDSDGNYTFVPYGLWSGQVPDIQYTISDGAGGTATAVLRITATAAPLNVDVPTVFTTEIPTVNGGGSERPLFDPKGNTPWTGNAFMDPSVFFEDFSFMRNMRLPTVIHPITYVNIQVQVAQLESRMQDMLKDWSNWYRDQATLLSSTNYLGMDPNLFVELAVRASQQERKFWEFLASNLQTNLPMAAPAVVDASLNDAGPIAPQAPQLAPVSVQPAEVLAVPVEADATETKPPQALLGMLERWTTSAEPEATAMRSSVMASKSSSFSDQLKQSSHELPSSLG